MVSGRICVIGSLNVDLTVGVSRFPLPGETLTGRSFDTFTGGKGGNQAIAAARLGADVYMVGCVGEDANGAHYLQELERGGVDARRVARVEEAPTGVALIEVDASGENRIVVVPGANHCLDRAAIDRALPTISSCGILLMQLEVPLDSVLYAATVARQNGLTVISDPAPAQPLSDALLALCDFITPNEHELNALTGLPSDAEQEAIDACRQLIERGARAVLNKRGGRGALLVTSDGAWAVPGYKVEAIDTTAAGDTFNAGFAVGLSLGMGLLDAVRLANAAGALSVTALGAQGAMPSFQRAVELCGNDLGAPSVPIF